MTTKQEAKPAREADIPEDFDPQPTVFETDTKHMAKVFEALRDADDDGYQRGHLLIKVDGWGVPQGKGTTCSPFTASVIAMLLDPSKPTSGEGPFKPEYNVNATRKAKLPPTFYSMHQGNSPGGVYLKRAKAHGYHASGDVESAMFFNLGYEVSPRDMRRGDLVHIEWPHGGHATFCWDAHLDDKGDVDAFQFVSSNGKLSPQTWGPGVSVCAGPKQLDVFISESGGKWKKKFNPLFDDRIEYVEKAGWYALPGTKVAAINKKTFRGKGPPYIVGPDAIAYVKVVRLWGSAPPTTDTNHPRYKPTFAQAAELKKWDPPKPYCMGEGTAAPTVHIENAKPQKVAGADLKKDPDAVDKIQHKPAQQKKDKVAPHQKEVELKLGRLFKAGWIDKDPGEPDDVYDAKSKDAIKAFQVKYGEARSLRTDGVADPKTRDVLDDILEILDADQPDPGARPASAPPPSKFTDVYWEYNRADPAGRAWLKVEGEHLDQVKKYELELKAEDGTKEKIHFRGDEIFDEPKGFNVPPSFGLFARLTAKIAAEVTGGGKIDADVVGTLELGPLEDPDLVKPKLVAPDNLLEWDEEKWPEKLRDLVEELRSTPRPTKEEEKLEEWALTQFGVKTKILAGDTPVKDMGGKVLATVALASLKKADIEGTMLVNRRVLNIDGSHGWTYDKVTHKPVKDSFDPDKSRWKDVTDEKPFGAGSRLPLIPFRVLAVNPKIHGSLFKRKVYIKQLDGLVMPTNEVHNGIVIVGDTGGMVSHHFDFFVGNEDAHLHIPSVGKRDGRQLVQVQVLGPSSAANKKKRH